MTRPWLPGRPVVRLPGFISLPSASQGKGIFSAECSGGQHLVGAHVPFPRLGSRATNKMCAGGRGSGNAGLGVGFSGVIWRQVRPMTRIRPSPEVVNHAAGVSFCGGGNRAPAGRGSNLLLNCNPFAAARATWCSPSRSTGPPIHDTHRHRQTEGLDRAEASGMVSSIDHARRAGCLLQDLHGFQFLGR